MNLAPILVAVLAGLLLGGGWWIYVDGVVDYHNHPHFNVTVTPAVPLDYETHWVLPGVITTVSVLFMNAVTLSQVKEHWEGRLWLFVTLTIAFLGICYASWILSDTFHGNEWPGISLVLQTTLVLLAGIVYFIRFGCMLGQNNSFGIYK